MAPPCELQGDRSHTSTFILLNHAEPLVNQEIYPQMHPSSAAYDRDVLDLLRRLGGELRPEELNSLQLHGLTDNLDAGSGLTVATAKLQLSLDWLDKDMQLSCSVQLLRGSYLPCARDDFDSVGILSRSRQLPHGVLQACLGPSQPADHRTLTTKVQTFYGLFHIFSAIGGNLRKQISIPTSCCKFGDW
jgi:hypothetical protein